MTSIFKRVFASSAFIVRASLSTNMANADPKQWKNAKSIYEFSAKDIDGKEVSLEKYK